MQILSIRCGLTRNLGNYESAKLEVEAAPSDGQSTSDLLVEVKDYLEQALPEGGAGSKKPAGKKSATPSAPLAGKGEKALTKKEIAAAKKAEKAAAAKQISEAVDREAPFDADVSDPTPAEKAEPAKPTKKVARMVFAEVVASKTLKDLLATFNAFRDPGAGYRALLTKNEWQNSVNVVQDCYKTLTTAESDADVMHDLVAAITSERNVEKGVR